MQDFARFFENEYLEVNLWWKFEIDAFKRLEL